MLSSLATAAMYKLDCVTAFLNDLEIVFALLKKFAATIFKTRKSFQTGVIQGPYGQKKAGKKYSFQGSQEK